MRINGWQRIGIVVSICWAFYGGFHEYNSYSDSAQHIYISDFIDCADAADAKQQSHEPCYAAQSKEVDNAIHEHWPYVWVAAFLPVLLGWGFVYAMIGIIKWVFKGFKKTSASTVA